LAKEREAEEVVERRREEEERRRRRVEEVVEARRRDPTSGLINAPIVDLDAVLLPAQGRVDQVDPVALLPQVILGVASALACAEVICVIVTENCVTVSKMSSVEQAHSVVVPSVVNLESTLLSVRLSRNDEAEYLSNEYQYY